MLNLWNQARPHIKFGFWLICSLYFAMIIMAFVLVGWDKGLDFAITRIGEVWWFLLQLYLVIPVTPMLILVLLDGLVHDTRSN